MSERCYCSPATPFSSRCATTRCWRDFIPSKLYDAMAVGRPAIVAAPGEAAAVVRRHGCGLEVGPEDGDGLARAVRTLMDDPATAQRLGAAGKAAASEYARSRQVDRLDELLREVAGRER